MNRTIPLALMLTIAAPAIASAGAFDNRMDRQHARIEQGRQTGDITWTEGNALRAEQNRIARTKARMESKGYLTRKERAQLAEMQNDASQNIRHKSHNRLHRLWGLPRVGK